MASSPTAPSSDQINPWFIAAAVMLATFMEVLDTSIAAVALPYIAGSVSATNDEATWVLTSYLVANAIVLPASGWFARKFGRKNFLVICIVIFTVASFACGAATSLPMILIARAVQGAGGGALQPLSQAILLETFPPEKRGQAMAAFGFGVVVAPVLGPTLGGWITVNYSWRWAFYINIPIGILAVILISRLVVDPKYIRDAVAGKLDAIGLGLLAVWLGALQIILDKGQEDDWFGATWIRWTAAILILSFIAFLWRELKLEKPLVDLRILLNRNFAVGCLQIGIFGAVVYAMITILPLFYQTLMGYTALAAGLAVAPRGIGAIFAMPIVGVLLTKIDGRKLIAIGFAGVGIANLWLGHMTLDVSQWSMFWAVTVSGFFIGFVFVPLATLAMGALPDQQIGNASGLYNLFRNVGGSIGISVVNTIVARHEQLHRTELSHSLSLQNPVLQRSVEGVQGLLNQHTDPVDALHKTYKLLEGTLDAQAALWSYIDDFRYLALMCFATVPIAFLLTKVSGRKAVAVH